MSRTNEISASDLAAIHYGSFLGHSVLVVVDDRGSGRTTTFMCDDVKRAKTRAETDYQDRNPVVYQRTRNGWRRR